MCVNNCKFAKDSSIHATLLKGKVQKCVGKSFALILVRIKTIRLFAVDFYVAIVDSAFGLINYHLLV